MGAGLTSRIDLQPRKIAVSVTGKQFFALASNTNDDESNVNLADCSAQL